MFRDVSTQITLSMTGRGADQDPVVRRRIVDNLAMLATQAMVNLSLREDLPAPGASLRVALTLDRLEGERMRISLERSADGETPADPLPPAEEHRALQAMLEALEAGDIETARRRYYALGEQLQARLPLAVPEAETPASNEGTQLVAQSDARYVEGSAPPPFVGDPTPPDAPEAPAAGEAPPTPPADPLPLPQE